MEQRWTPELEVRGIQQLKQLEFNLLFVKTFSGQQLSLENTPWLPLADLVIKSSKPLKYAYPKIKANQYLYQGNKS